MCDWIRVDGDGGGDMVPIGCVNKVVSRWLDGDVDGGGGGIANEANDDVMGILAGGKGDFNLMGDP